MFTLEKSPRKDGIKCGHMMLNKTTSWETFIEINPEIMRQQIKAIMQGVQWKRWALEIYWGATDIFSTL